MAERPYHHGDLRTALLLAGRRSIEESGRASLNLRGLARTVGVAAPSVYNHFPGISALILALAEEGFAELSAALKDAGPESMSLGLAYLGFARSNPSLYRLMFCEVLSFTSPEEATLRARRQAAFAPLISITGSREAALHHWALVHGLASLIIDGQIPLGHDPEVQIRDILTYRS